jgi:drug/metabolite transporter (DMT)-like permease
MAGEWSVLAIVGAVFIVLGVIGILWGRYEQKKLDEALTTHVDVREFISHWPERPQPEALKIGGWIAFAVGVLMMIIGLAIWYTGLPS